MAFLDNSGDIILDAVLTDAGRQRMARGEFKIVKFALGDEEINYGLFNGNHPSGSAFSDLKIMQTPILEAFTNNTSLMKTKLISFNRNNILYLPIMRVNESPTADASVGKKNSGKASTHASHFANGWIMLADKATRDAFKEQNAELDQGIFYGTGDVNIPNYSKNICIDQGIETQNKVPTETTIPQDLVESAYLIKVDHRLMRLRLMINEGDNAAPGDYSESNLVSSFVDDDAIASYYVGAQSLITPGQRRNKIRSARDDGDANPSLATLQSAEAFQGPIGPRLRIHPRSSLHIQQTDSLFDELGTTSTGAITIRGHAVTGYKYIDTLINIVGVTTGNTIDLPVRIIKKS